MRNEQMIVAKHEDAAALALVEGPSRAIRINSGISALLCIGSYGFAFYRFSIEAGQRELSADQTIEVLWSWTRVYAMYLLPVFIGSAVTFKAAGSMARLENRRFVQVGIVMSCVPLFVWWCNWPFALAFGAWGVWTMRKPHVAQAFTTNDQR